MSHSATIRALNAVAAGAVKHAHPFTWAVEPEFIDVSPRTLQRLASERKIKVNANDKGYWRSVELVRQSD